MVLNASLACPFLGYALRALRVKQRPGEIPHTERKIPPATSVCVKVRTRIILRRTQALTYGCYWTSSK